MLLQKLVTIQKRSNSGLSRKSFNLVFRRYISIFRSAGATEFWRGYQQRLAKYDVNKYSQF